MENSNRQREITKKEKKHPIPSLESIFFYRDRKFSEEFIDSNKLNFFTTCEVKTQTQYEFGFLKIKNNTLTIYSFDPQKQNVNEQTIEEPRIIIFPEEPKINKFRPLFHINFNLISCKLIVHKQKPKFRILILGYLTNECILPFRVIKFLKGTEKDEVFYYILEIINKAIITSEGYKNNIITVSLRENFFRDYFIEQPEFIKRAKTGDILLFRGLLKTNVCQRYITRDEYDHIAIIIKNKEILKIFEVTGNEGVKSRPFSSFLINFWYLYYDKITYRELLVSREAMENALIKNNENHILLEEWLGKISINSLQKLYLEMLTQQVEDFAKDNSGKKYSLNGCNFLCENKMKESGQRKTFFCSQLVAAVYYQCGIISNKVDIGHFLPGSFSKNKDLSLEPGYKLGKEYIINFSS